MSTNFKNDTVAERAAKYMKENNELLKKYRLVARLIVNFPFKQKAPILSRIALWLVGKQGGQLDMQFGEFRKE